MLLSLADVNTVKIYWAAIVDSMRNKVDINFKARGFQGDLKESISFEARFFWWSGL